MCQVTDPDEEVYQLPNIPCIDLDSAVSADNVDVKIASVTYLLPVLELSMEAFVLMHICKNSD